MSRTRQAQVPTDGRHNRALETRARIVQALTDLIREGRVTPTAEEVSARAQVGLRTVFRHFDDMETLYREINQQLQAMIEPVVNANIVPGNWQSLLLDSVKTRGELYERITPFYLVGQVHRHESPSINANIQRGVSLERSVLLKSVPKPIASQNVRFEAMLLLLSIDAWVRLRREQALSFDTAVKVIQLSVLALLQSTPAATLKAGYPRASRVASTRM